MSIENLGRKAISLGVDPEWRQIENVNTSFKLVEWNKCHLIDPFGFHQYNNFCLKSIFKNIPYATKSDTGLEKVAKY